MRASSVSAATTLQGPVGTCDASHCTAPEGGQIWRYECDGQQTGDHPECRENGSNQNSTDVSWGGGSCNKTIQYDAWGPGQGPGDGTIGFVVYYTGDCPGGTTPSGPKCLAASAFVGDPNKEKNSENRAGAPGLGENVYLVCKKVPNGARYRFRIIYTRKTPYSTLADGTIQKLKALTNTGKMRNRSVAFKAPMVGFYYGQCSACVPSGNGEKCSAWESTTVAGARLTNTAGTAVSGAGASFAADIDLNEDISQETLSAERSQSVDDEDELGDANSVIELPLLNNEDLNESDVVEIPASELAAQD